MRRLVLATLLFLAPLGAAAQSLASLVADEVTIDGNGRLVATGNVEVLFEGTRMSAGQIIYDQAADRLSIAGPIFIEGADGQIITAERADLDPRLENGLLRGARLVLERQLQLAANRIDRVDGRYSVLTQTAATSCQVCGTEAPLWEIRATQVIHDAEEQQLYFENATLRVRGIPVLWVPSMRLPDPSLERATGLLVPRIRTTDQLGIGIKIPYFITLGDSRDLTLTPYLSPQTRTLEVLYRQAYMTGRLEIEGAITRDDIRPGELRGYVMGGGEFAVAQGQTLAFDIEYATDNAYLRDYGYSEKDRLDSAISFVGVTADSLLQAELTYYQTLRTGELQGALPPFVSEFSYEHRLDLAGGALDWGFDAEAFQRTDDTSGATARDVARLGGTLSWSRDWLLPMGVLFEARAGAELGYYLVSDDAEYDSEVFRATPSIQTTLRWPLARTTSSGAVHVIEPLVALAWSRTSGDAVPNEDSLLVEFDEANLTGLTRYPGEDVRETGLRTAVGLGWSRHGPDGSVMALSFGRIFRQTPDDGFPIASGLAGATSDWLLTGRLDLPGGVTATARTIFNDDFDFDKTEARLDWQSEALSLATAYVWLPEEPGEGRDAPISEWSLDTAYRINDNWAVSFDGRYDLANNQPVEAGLGVEWRNECVVVDLSVSRSYTSNAEVEPVTDYGLAVQLTGFSAGDGAARPVRDCR